MHKQTLKEKSETLVRGNSNFRGPVSATVAGVAGSEITDRLFHFLLLNV